MVATVTGHNSLTFQLPLATSLEAPDDLRAGEGSCPHEFAKTWCDIFLVRRKEIGAILCHYYSKLCKYVYIDNKLTDLQNNSFEMVLQLMLYWAFYSASFIIMF